MTETDRGIFGPYDPGDGSERYADPVEVQECFAACLGGEPNATLRAARDADPAVSFEAWQRLKAASVEALGLFVFDPATGQGLTLKQVRCVVNEFLQFCTDLKKNTAGSPTGATAMDSRPARSRGKKCAGCGSS